MTPARFPHSDTPGSTLGCQLPRAYRRLLRPSSALDAKASTTCPSQLVTHHTPSTNRSTDQQINRSTDQQINRSGQPQVNHKINQQADRRVTATKKPHPR